MFIYQILMEQKLTIRPVNGGKVLADCPRLSNKDLFGGRDLYPTMDVRSLFKGILEEHLLLPESFVECEVFSDSIAARPIRDIVRA
jgi:uncharacterized protein (DUF1501 family)